MIQSVGYSLIVALIIAFSYSILPPRWRKSTASTVVLLSLTIPQTQLQSPVDTRYLALAMTIVAVVASIQLGRSIRLSALVPMLLFFTWLIITAFWSSGSNSYVFVQVLFVGGLFFFTLATGAVEDKLSDILTALGFLLIPLTVAVALLNGPSSLLLAERLRGPFQNPDTLGALLVVILPAIIHTAGRAEWPIMIVTVALVWETGSRAALLAIAAQVVLITFARLRLYGRVCTLAFLLFAFIHYLPKLITAASQNGAGSSTILRSNDSRQAVWTASELLAEKNPFKGSGIGSYTSQFETGSSFFALWIQGGIIALALFGICVFASFQGASSLYDWRFITLVGGLVDAAFEGWIIAAGTVFSVVLWSLIGSLLNSRKLPIARSSIDPQIVSLNIG